METDNLQLPFLTRDMLRFKGGIRFQLRITTKSFGSQAITIRGLTREGAFTFKHTLVATGAETQELFNVPDFPIMVSVVDEAAAVKQANTVVTLDLVANGDKLQELCSGWVYQGKGISYPHNNTMDKLPFRGMFTSITGSNPNPNAECSDTVPTDQIWKLLGWRARLDTDANAANRRVHLNITVNSGVVFDIFNAEDQAASLTRWYNFGNFGDILDPIDGTSIMLTLPPEIYLPAGSIISTVTTNRQATDNFYSPQIYVERFFD